MSTDHKDTSRLPFEHIALFTAFALGIWGYSFGAYAALMMLLLPIAILYPASKNTAWFWALAAAMHVPLFLTGLTGWIYVGNQKFVAFYWCVILFIACLQQTKMRDAITYYGAYYLITVIFIIASIWKWSSADYTNGALLHYMLVAGPLDLVGALLYAEELNWTGFLEARDALAVNFETIQSALHVAADHEALPLVTSPLIQKTALFLSYASLITQSLLGISFAAYLIWKRTWLMVLGHAMLIEFIVIAYLPTQVIGFGFLLSVLGYTVACATIPRLRRVYIALMLLMCIYDIPIRAIIFDGSPLFASY